MIFVLVGAVLVGAALFFCGLLRFRNGWDGLTMKELAIWLIESVTVTEGSPILVDTGAFGTLYLGATEWAVNPYEEFRTNRSRGRLEVPMLVFVERPEAIVEIMLA